MESSRPELYLVLRVQTEVSSHQRFWVPHLGQSEMIVFPYSSSRKNHWPDVMGTLRKPWFKGVKWGSQNWMVHVLKQGTETLVFQECQGHNPT